MKKFVSMVLIVALLATCGAFAAFAQGAASLYTFDSFMIANVDTSVDEWLGSEDMRALCTVVLAMELMHGLNEQRAGQSDELTPQMAEPTYIGRDGDNIVVYLHAPGTDFLVTYYTNEKKCSFMKMSPMDDSVVLSTLNGIYPDGCSENSLDMIMYAINGLQEAING